MAKLLPVDLFYQLIEGGASIKEAISKSGYIPSAEELQKLSPTSVIPPKKAAVLDANNQRYLQKEALMDPAVVPPVVINKELRKEALMDPTGPAANTVRDAAPIVRPPQPATTKVEDFSAYPLENRARAKDITDKLKFAKGSLFSGNTSEHTLTAIKEMEAELARLMAQADKEEYSTVDRTPKPADWDNSFKRHYEAMGAANKGSATEPLISTKKAGIPTSSASLNDIPEKKVTPETPPKKKSGLDLYGLPILEVIQAGLFGYTGNTEKKAYERRLEKAAIEAEKAFIEKIDKDKREWEDVTRKNNENFLTNQNTAAERNANARSDAELANRLEIAKMGHQDEVNPYPDVPGYVGGSF